MAQAEVDFSTILEHSLATLPSDESVLIPLYEAYRASGEALMAVLNKPRTNGAAAEVLEDDIERANSYACAIAVKLSHLSSVTEFWRETYLEVMLSHVFFTGGDASDVLGVLAKATALPVTEPRTAH
jgi:hypothetical protein